MQTRVLGSSLSLSSFVASLASQRLNLRFLCENVGRRSMYLEKGLHGTRLRELITVVPSEN